MPIYCYMGIELLFTGVMFAGIWLCSLKLSHCYLLVLSYYCFTGIKLLLYAGIELLLFAGIEIMLYWLALN